VWCDPSVAAGERWKPRVVLVIRRPWVLLHQQPAIPRRAVTALAAAAAPP